MLVTVLVIIGLLVSQRSTELRVINLPVPPVVVPSGSCTETAGSPSCAHQFCSQLTIFPSTGADSILFDTAVYDSPPAVRAQNVALMRAYLAHRISMTQAFNTMKGEGKC
jgi:hypothetical protein